MLAREDSKFSHETKSQDGKTLIYLKGQIDEDSNFDEIKTLSGILVFNFKDVTGINSCGVRNWVNLIKNLQGQIFYAECAPLIVRQLNMVPSFKGSAQVASVYVPYVCDSCEHERSVLVHHEVFSKPQPQISMVITCDKCGKEEMEFDGSPEQYFAFSR